MNRREYLSILPLGGAGLAGCLATGSTEQSQEENSASNGNDTADNQDESSAEQDLFKTRFSIDDLPQDHLMGGIRLESFEWQEIPHYLGGGMGIVGQITNETGELQEDIRITADYYVDDLQVGSHWNMPEDVGDGEYVTVALRHRADDVEPDDLTHVGISVHPRQHIFGIPNDGHVTLNDTEFTTGEDSELRGVIENTSGGPLSRVYIDVNFYRENEIVEYGTDAVSRFEEDTSATWSVLYSNPNVPPEEVDRRKISVTVRKP